MESGHESEITSTKKQKDVKKRNVRIIYICMTRDTGNYYGSHYFHYIIKILKKISFNKTEVEIPLQKK